jgi:4-amino-4-deoxy-L-arabinose transferase-like glycosyltransferase
VEATKSITAFQATGLKRLVLYLLNYWPVLVLCSLAALVLLWGLGKASLDDWDEAIFAQISKEMVQSGNWLTLHWEYKPYFKKPPLLMWSTAIFYLLFGVNEFWARAASAFSGIGLIGVTYLIGKFVYGRRVGLFAAVILLSSYQFVRSARFGTTDVMLTLFIFLAVYAYLRLEQNNQRWWYVIGISCGLAVMTKGAAGLVAPGTIGLVLLLDRRLIATTRSKHSWLAILLAVVIVAPWHIAIYLEHRQAFINQYILSQAISRATRSLEEHTGTRYFYIDRLQKYFSPWFYLVPFALALTIKENIRGRSKSRIVLLLVIVVFGLYTAVRTKLRWYIMPLYPALSILTASMVVEAFLSHKTAAFGGLLVATLAAATVAPKDVVLLCGGIGIAVFCLFLAIRMPVYRPLVIVMSVFLIVAAAVGIQPIYRPGEAPVARLAKIAGSTHPNDREPLVVFSGLYRPTPLFYSDRPIQVAYTLEDLAGFTQDHQTKEIILAKKDVGPLSVEYETYVLAEVEPYVYALIKLRD